MAFLVGLVSLSTFAFCVSYSVQSVGLDEKVWLNAIEESGAVDQLLAHSGLGGQVSPELVKRILSKEWIDGQTKNLVHNVLSYVKGESANLELIVDLTEPKERLQALGLGQLDAVKDVPDRIDLAQRPGAKEGVDQFRQYVQALQTAVMASIVMALLSIAALVLWAKDAKSKVRLPSTGLMLGGLNALLLAFVLGEVIQKNLPSEFQVAAQAIIAPLLGSVNTWAAAFVVIGVLGLAASHWFVKNDSKAA